MNIYIHMHPIFPYHAKRAFLCFQKPVMSQPTHVRGVLSTNSYCWKILSEIRACEWHTAIQLCFTAHLLTPPPWRSSSQCWHQRTQWSLCQLFLPVCACFLYSFFIFSFETITTFSKSLKFFVCVCVWFFKILFEE